MSPVSDSNTFISLYNLCSLLSSAHGPSVGVGVSSLLVILGLKVYKRTSKLPGALVVVFAYIIVMVIWNKAIDSTGILMFVFGIVHECVAASRMQLYAAFVFCVAAVVTINM